MSEPATNIAELHPLRPEHWVCTGRFFDGKELFNTFRVCLNHELGTLASESEGTRTFKAKRGRAFTVGHVYLIEANANQARIAGAVYVGAWPKEADRAMWATSDEAHRAKKASVSAEKRETSRDFLRELLEPVRIAYRRTNHDGRIAIELAVIRALKGL